MDWSKVGDVVADAAPLVGTLLGGPAGGAVGGLVAKAGGSLGRFLRIAVEDHDLAAPGHDGLGCGLAKP